MSNDSALIDRFLEMMAAESGASVNTLAAYRSDLSQSSDYLAGQMSSASRKALAKLNKEWRDLKTTTISRKASAVLQLFAGRRVS